MRSPQYISRRNGQHWVGDGFYVSTLLSHADRRRDPFLLFDYAAPQDFPAAAADTPPRGVGAHPHKGFETVTLAFQGEVAHRDSGGNGGIIGAGDVQWMTAGRGIVHQEFHSEAFTRRGGTFEMAQLWVNYKTAAAFAPNHSSFCIAIFKPFAAAFAPSNLSPCP